MLVNDIAVVGRKIIVGQTTATDIHCEEDIWIAANVIGPETAIGNATGIAITTEEIEVSVAIAVIEVIVVTGTVIDIAVRLPLLLLLKTGIFIHRMVFSNCR